MLHDLPEYKYDSTFKVIEPTENDYVVFLSDNKPLINDCGELPKYNKDFKDYKFRFLFSMNDVNFFYCEKEDIKLDGYTYRMFNRNKEKIEKWLIFSGITALQFSKWYSDNKYCSKCGKEYKHSKTEKMLYCDKCHTTIYPRINPCVIVAVIDRENNKVLTTLRKGGNSPALVSGFCEVGEPLEETCKREVFEETGVRIKNLRYYKSQPWSYTDTLLMGFVCELDGDNKLTIDYNENDGASWMSKEELGIKNQDFSLTREILDEFSKGNL